MGVRVMLGSRRIKQLEKYLTEDSIEAAYALSAALGRHPHWNPQERIFYIHSILAGRRVLVACQPGPGEDVRDELARVVNDLRTLVEGAGGTLSMAEENTYGPLLGNPETDGAAFIILRPRPERADVPALRAVYTYNQLFDSRLLARTIVSRIRHRLETVHASTQLLWNRWADNETYNLLASRLVPSVVVEWASDPGVQPSTLAYYLGGALREGLEVTLRAREAYWINIQSDPLELERQLARLETSKTPEQAQRVSGGYRRNESHTTGQWVSSREFKGQLPSPGVSALSPEREREGRAYAREKRGG